MCYVDAIKLQNENVLINNSTKLRAYGHELSTGKIFATYPSSHITLLGSIIDQVLLNSNLLTKIYVILIKILSINYSKLKILGHWNSFSTVCCRGHRR